MRSREFQDGYDSALAEAAGSVEEMSRQVTDARRMLVAAAISSESGLVINDGALSRVDMYDVIMERDERNARLRIRVKPRS